MRSLSSYMAAGSSGIMIDALVWCSGLLLPFGGCLDKRVHKTSHTGGNKSAAKHQSLRYRRVKELGTCASTLRQCPAGPGGDKGTKKRLPLRLDFRVTVSSHSSTSLKLSLRYGLIQE